MRFIPLLAICATVMAFGTACPPTTTVTPDAGVEEPPQLCVDDEECTVGFCRFGVCVESECLTKGDCASTLVCVTGECVEPPANCRGPDDCPGDGFCDGFSNVCFFPGEGEGEGEGEQPGEGEGEGEGEQPGEGEGEGEQPGEGEGEGEGEGTAVSLDGYRLEDRETSSGHVSVLPSGITLNPGQSLVIVRNATQNQFTNKWGSIGNARFLDGEIESTGVPIVNGRERFTLLDGNRVVDGPAFTGASTKKCYQRTGSDANNRSDWDELPEADATPGTAATVPGRSGLTITEWCDADGDSQLEFIEVTNLR